MKEHATRNDVDDDARLSAPRRAVDNRRRRDTLLKLEHTRMDRPRRLLVLGVRLALAAAPPAAP